MNLAHLVPAFHIRGPLLAAICALAAGCAPSFPPVAQAARGDAGFKRDIAIHFPPGTSAARLRAMLAVQGFRLIEDPALRRYSAIDAPPNLPCLSTTRVDWTEDARGRIAQIQAARHSCS